MVKEIIGHVGMDDSYSQDGIINMFSEQGNEDDLFRGQFLIIDVKDSRFFGQIIDEPKNYPLSGQATSAMNEYPILHHEKVQYIPGYKVVTKIKLLGEITDNLKLASHFTRPRPASKVKHADLETVRSLLNVSGKDVLGVLMGYEDVQNPITISMNDQMGRKQLGIFGMTGTGKSNSCLRVAEIYSNMGWCVIFLDYLGEYVRCMQPSDEKELFSERWTKLGVTPLGNKNVQVYLPISDTREIEGVKKFTLKTKDIPIETVLSMFGKGEAQKREFFPILQEIYRDKWHLQTFSNILAEKIESLPETKRGSLSIIKRRIDNQLNNPNRLFDNFEAEYANSNTKTLGSFEKIGVKVPKKSVSDLDPIELLQDGRINVIDFKNVSESDYAATILVLLKRVYKLKKEHGEKPNNYPKVMIMIEEAHIPFNENDKGNIYAQSLNSIAREVFKIGRHYYLNICAISQRPSDIPDSILSQVNTRIIHRLKTFNDISKVITGDIKEYSNSVPALKTGEAIIDSTDFITPLTMKISPCRSKKVDPYLARE